MRSRGTDESGAALVLVLIIVTVLSLGLLAVVSLSTANIRTTVAMRAQAGESYAADAAAKIAVDQLRRDAFPGGCGGVNTLTLNNFYPAAGTTPSASATVRCTPDPDNGGGSGGANSSPGSAILTLGTNSEPGIRIDSSNNRSVKVRGGVFANSTIYLEGNKSDLENTAPNSYVYAMGSCLTNGSKIISSPAAVCDYSAQPASANDRRGKDPATIPSHGASFDPPAIPSVVRTPPACTGEKVYELQPGRYTSVTELNALTANSCSGSVFHANPGIYYFDFQDGGAHEWTVNGYLVAGTAKATLKTKPAPAMPGSCVAPGTAASSTSSGALFVFGGDSRIRVGDDAHVEICASNTTSGPPMAIYGHKTTQSGCITAVPYPTVGCAVLRADKSPKSTLTIQGSVYAPRSMIDLSVNNNSVQVLRWGLISRGFRLDATGSASALANPVIDVPSDAPAPYAVPDLVYLDVYVCPGAGTCDTNGVVKLRAKVLVSPDSPRTVTVLSWSRPG